MKRMGLSSGKKIVLVEQMERQRFHCSFYLNFCAYHHEPFSLCSIHFKRSTTVCAFCDSGLFVRANQTAGLGPSVVARLRTLPRVLPSCSQVQVILQSLLGKSQTQRSSTGTTESCPGIKLAVFGTWRWLIDSGYELEMWWWALLFASFRKDCTRL